MSFVFLFTSILCAVSGQVLLKNTVTNIEGVDFASSKMASHLIKLLRYPLFYIAMAVYFLSMILYLVAISKLDISLAYPMVSLNYAIILVYSKVFYKENVTPLRWIGVAVIIFGVVLISRS